MRPRLVELVSQLTQDEPPLATATHDGCRTGQNNWKVHDEFAHDCMLVYSVAFQAAATPDEVRDAILTMANRLEALGCHADGDLDLRRIASGYWGSAEEAAAQDYRPGEMPFVLYGCDGLRIEIEYLDPVTFAKYREIYEDPWWPYFRLDDELATTVSISPDDLLQKMSADGVAMVWSMNLSGSYYQVRF